MPKKCCVVGCRSNYKRKIEECSSNSNHVTYKTVFSFPDSNQLDLRNCWIKFVNRADWSPTENSVICIDHFEDKYLKRGKRITLNYCENPIPTIITNQNILSKPSLIQSTSALRKPPAVRIYSHPFLDETYDFRKHDTIKSIIDLNESFCPAGFSFKLVDNRVLFLRIYFDDGDVTPNIESITIDKDLHVKLHMKGIPVPLPKWFREGSVCKLTSASMLVNFVSYMHEVAKNVSKSVLSDLYKLSLYKPQGRPIYTNEIIRFSLMHRYTSKQAYTLLLEEFPLPSLSYLKSLSKGGIDPLSGLLLLLENGSISADCVVLIDEMYLQKGVQYHGGSLIGADDDGNFYSGIFVFMVVSLKESIPFVIKACPEFQISGSMISSHIEETLDTLYKASFNVRAIITDNHATNVSAFKILRLKFGEQDNEIYFTFMGHRVYNLYDSVHLLKNIRNNLLNSKRFVFPPFDFIEFDDIIHVEAGEISWSLLHNVYEKDELLPANLKKAFKLSAQTLHPGNNKQSVPLALNIFDETTSAAIISYFPNETAAAGFLRLINIWWTISNSKVMFNTNNRIGNAAIPGDKKSQFFRVFATWINEWKNLQFQRCNKYTLSAQTTNALITTLKGTASLIEDLFSEGYKYVLNSRFQTDPLERHFSKYRQMSGGRFLVSLREVQSSEKILCMKSLIKANINCWTSNLKLDTKINKNELLIKLEKYSNEIQENELCHDSYEVAINISGYITKKIGDKYNCSNCLKSLSFNKVSTEYLEILSRGGLTKPSKELANYVCNGFIILDTVKKVLLKYSHDIKNASLLALEKYQPSDSDFMCIEHEEWGRHLVNTIITNIYFNNEQQIKNGNIRKNEVAAFKVRQTKKDK